MRAAVYHEYGAPEVVQIEEVPTPEPEANEVLVKVHATTVASGDWRMRSATVPKSFRLIAPLIFGRRPKKKILGTELSGTIAKLGSAVEAWQVGDAVFAFPGTQLGAHAEYLCMPATGRIARKPEALSFAEAAALCFGGSTALHFFDKGGGIRAGERVLVVGASGSVGSAMLQMAKHFGAEVTGVCSAANLELVRSLGADRVIDYQQEDFLASTERYHVVVDTTGTAPLARCKPILERGGRLLMVDGSLGDMLRAPLSFGIKVVAGPAYEDPAHLPRLAELAQRGAFKPLIDQTFAFDDIAHAHRRVETRRKRGNVVVIVTPQ